MQILKALYKDEAGQGTTEYMIIISVVVAAVLAAAYAFMDPFQKGVEQLGANVQKTLGQGFK